MAERVICPWCQGAAMVEPGDPLPTRQPTWTRERPSVPGWFWFKWPDERLPSVAEVTQNSFSVWVVGIYALLHEKDVEGCLWAGPIQPPPLPEGHAVTHEERTHILAYWKDRGDVPFGVLEAFAEDVDERDALLVKAYHQIHGEWSGCALEDEIRACVGDEALDS